MLNKAENLSSVNGLASYGGREREREEEGGKREREEERGKGKREDEEEKEGKGRETEREKEITIRSSSFIPFSFPFLSSSLHQLTLVSVPTHD